MRRVYKEMTVPFKYNQTAILKKMMRSLQKDKRPKKLVKKFDDGHCSGLSVLYVYCKRLSTRPLRYDDDGRVILRDDYQWFKKTRHDWVDWRGKSKLKGYTRFQCYRFMSLMHYFQDGHPKLPFSQGEMHLFLEDTRHAKIIREYSLAGLFAERELAPVLQKIVHENRMILLSSHNHDCALIKVNGNYCFFNPSDDDELVSTSLETIAKAVFAANDFKPNDLCPLGIRIFHLPDENEQSVSYPSQKIILESLTFITYNMPNCSHADYENETALNIAAFINCAASIKVIAHHRADLNSLSDEKYTPLMTAGRQGASDAAKALIELGANTTLKSPNGKTAKKLAEINYFSDCVRVMTDAETARQRKQTEEKSNQSSLCARVNTAIYQTGSYFYSRLPELNLFGFFSNHARTQPQCTNSNLQIQSAIKTAVASAIKPTATA